MKRDFLEEIVNELPIGYACIKMIRDAKGDLCDFECANVNTVFESVTGLTKERIVYKKKWDLKDSYNLSENSTKWVHLCKDLLEKKRSTSIEHYSEELNCWFRINVKELHRVPDHLLLFFEDISIEIQKLKELKQKADSYKYMSFHDSLTKLYNRAFFEEGVKRLSTARELPLSIIMADVNDLKLTNDILGHRIGDQLLQKTAEVLKSCCREGDIVARVGGDEFKVLLPKTSHIDTEKIVGRLINTCSKTYVKSRPLSVSFGWATKTTNCEDIEKIQRKAEENMYRNKLKRKENAIR